MKAILAARSTPRKTSPEEIKWRSSSDPGQWPVISSSAPNPSPAPSSSHPTPPTNYYIVKAGLQHGPYSDDQVRTMLQQRSIALQDLFWRDGQAEWMPLSQWDGVFASGPAPQPGPALSPAAAGTVDSNSRTLIGFGYACAAISLVFLPILFAPAGVLIGVKVRKRGLHPHGSRLIVASAVAGIIGFLLGMAVNA